MLVHSRLRTSAGKFSKVAKKERNRAKQLLDNFSKEVSSSQHSTAVTSTQLTRREDQAQVARSTQVAVSTRVAQSTRVV